MVTWTIYGIIICIFIKLIVYTCCTGSMQVSEESCTHDMTAGHSTNRFSQVLIIHSTHGCCDNHESILRSLRFIYFVNQKRGNDHKVQNWNPVPFSLKTNAVPTELNNKLTFYQLVLLGVGSTELKYISIRILRGSYDITVFIPSIFINLYLNKPLVWNILK